MSKLFSLQKDGRVRNSHFATSAQMLSFRRAGKYQQHLRFINTDTAKIMMDTSVTVPSEKKIVEFERAEHTYLPP